MRHFSVLDISLYQIQLFLTVAEVRNFSRAATRVHMTQPTLSRRISLLEDTIGAKLFDRDKRPVELTAAGKILLQEWVDIYAKFEASIEKALDTDRRGSKKLIVSTMDSTRHLLAIHITGQEMEEEFAGLAFSWEYNSFMKWRNRLYDGDIDIMLTIKLEEGSLGADVFSEQIMTCPKLVCMLKTNPLSKKNAITYKDLRTQHFVAVSPGAMPYHYNYIRKICREHGGFRPKVTRYATHPQALVASLKNDNEVVVCDLFLRDVDSPMIKAFPLPDTNSGLVAVWRKDNVNPYIRPYLNKLKNNFIKHYPAVYTDEA